jgi:hypothetical protein
MEVLPQRLLTVVAYTNDDAVYSIAFKYIDCDGQQRTAVCWSMGRRGPGSWEPP